MTLDDLTYVLPLKWAQPGDMDDMARYLEALSQMVSEVIVVDASADPVVDEHRRAWAPAVTVIPPDGDLDYAMGKVNGVVTGIRRARTEHVVIADDDVRYDEGALVRVRALLEEAELVRPQNYFDPLPWHAAWDTSRSLLNRCFRADYPGTLGLRRSFFMALGGTYDGDCMFENLELMRTIEAGGGRVVSPLDLYVRRLPPTAHHFWSQRVRQAYDDLAQPLRLTFFLSLLPAVVGTPRRRRGKVAVAIFCLSIGLGEIGRRRAGGTRYFPAHTSLMAPAWIAERAICSWLAVASKVARGGIPYAGSIVPKAANSPRELRRRLVQAARERCRPET